jgi:hypothetical protein
MKKASTKRVTKQTSEFPSGWDETRARRVKEHYEKQTPEEAAAEDDAAWKNKSGTVVQVPVELLPAVRALIAKRASRGKRTKSPTTQAKSRRSA